MKKFILIVLLAFNFSAGVFANIIIQADASMFGACIDVTARYQNDKTDPAQVYYFDTVDFAGGLLWEFGNIGDSKVYPFVGAEVGLSSWGFPVVGVGGVNINLFDMGPATTELQVALKAGPAFELFGGVDVFSQISADMIFMSKTRKWLYGGIGISCQNTTVTYSYESLTVISGHVVAGVRF